MRYPVPLSSMAGLVRSYLLHFTHEQVRVRDSGGPTLILTLTPTLTHTRLHKQHLLQENEQLRAEGRQLCSLVERLRKTHLAAAPAQASAVAAPPTAPAPERPPVLAPAPVPPVVSAPTPALPTVPAPAMAPALPPAPAPGPALVPGRRTTGT